MWWQVADKPHSSEPDRRRFPFDVAIDRFETLKSRHDVISDKDLALLVLAANSSPAQPEVLQQHVEQAAGSGAGLEEILEVLALTSLAGIHGGMLGASLLVEELEQLGPSGRELEANQKAAKDSFIEERGFWTSLWDDFLQLDPELLGAYTELSTSACATGALSDVVRELVLITLDLSTPTIHEHGARVHIRKAIDAGAQREHLIAVLAVVSAAGFSTWRLGSRLAAGTHLGTQARGSA